MFASGKTAKEPLGVISALLYQTRLMLAQSVSSGWVQQVAEWVSQVLNNCRAEKG